MNFNDYKVTHATLLIDILTFLGKIDNYLSRDELDVISNVKSIYGLTNYRPESVSKKSIFNRIEDISVSELTNFVIICTHLANADGVYDNVERDFIDELTDYLPIRKQKEISSMTQSLQAPSSSNDDLFDNIEQSEENTYLKEFSKTSPDKVKFDEIQRMKRGPVKKVWNKVLSLWSIVKSDQVPLSAKAVAVGALVYLVSPVDAIPDILPVVGLGDDVSVITLAITNLSKYMYLIKGLK